MFDRDPNHISARTRARRDRRKLNAEQTRKAKELRDQGRSFDDIDTILGVVDGTALAAHAGWRDTDSASNNAVLNIDPADRDGFRKDYCLPGEAARPAFKRHLQEVAYYRTFALAAGCQPYSGPLS